MNISTNQKNAVSHIIQSFRHQILKIDKKELELSKKSKQSTTTRGEIDKKYGPRVS